jgi:hypothetical protein
MVTLASAPSGELWDGVFDMQVPLDKDGNYTIVVSRRRTGRRTRPPRAASRGSTGDRFEQNGS